MDFSSLTVTYGGLLALIVFLFGFWAKVVSPKIREVERDTRETQVFRTNIADRVSEVEEDVKEIKEDLGEIKKIREEVSSMKLDVMKSINDLKSCVVDRVHKIELDVKGLQGEVDHCEGIKGKK